MSARYLNILRAVSKPERFARALALSALARDMAWQGAVRHSGHDGAYAVTERFLLQLYGPDVGPEVAKSLSRASDASE
ncbi:MAG TPA: hypothetical protein VII66_11920 [Gemmatimonadaceae bacterium]